MTAPLKILLADDQVPWDTSVKNDRTKEEIRKAFKHFGPEEFGADFDVDKAFAEDYKWFKGLLAYLDSKNTEVVRVRTFKEAMRRIKNPRNWDVAVVDLSWFGDYTVRRVADRKGKGKELLEAANGSCSKVPVICMSQRFRSDLEHMSTVLELGAFPLPKDYKNPELSYRVLHAASQYLNHARWTGESEVELFIIHAHEDRDLAERLVEAIEFGFHVPPDAIRCSSVPKYSFPPGTDFVQALKYDVAAASCVVGIWTPGSLKSQWCLFELGAAWGLAQKTLFLSLGTEALREPPTGFRSIQDSKLDDAQQLSMFLDQLAKITAWQSKDRLAAGKRLGQLAKYVKDRSGSSGQRLSPSLKMAAKRRKRR